MGRNDSLIRCCCCKRDRCPLSNFKDGDIVLKNPSCEYCLVLRRGDIVLKFPKPNRLGKLLDDQKRRASELAAAHPDLLVPFVYENEVVRQPFIAGTRGTGTDTRTVYDLLDERGLHCVSDVTTSNIVRKEDGQLVLVDFSMSRVGRTDTRSRYRREGTRFEIYGPITEEMKRELGWIT